MPQRWCNAAELRRHQIESGLDLTFNLVFKPLWIKYILSLNPVTVLEVGAGTGHLSLEVANLGFAVDAVEPSIGMFNVAKDVLNKTQVELHNCSLNGFSSAKKYDLAFSHLVAHVVEDLDEFLIATNTYLGIGGHLSFSIPHPCFYNGYKNIMDHDYNYMKIRSQDISFSITKDPENLIFDVPYHHRPLNVYIDSIVKSGFILEHLEEVYPDPEIQMEYGTLWETPRYCVFICKKYKET